MLDSLSLYFLTTDSNLERASSLGLVLGLRSLCTLSRSIKNARYFYISVHNRTLR